MEYFVEEVTCVREWKTDKYPFWLVFEVEGRLQIRPEQYIVAKHLIENPGSICQLNMGRGKTRVILPMLSLYYRYKATGRAMRAHFLSPLLSETREFMHRVLSSGSLRLPLVELPFNRTIELSLRQVFLMQEAVNDVKQNGGFVLLAPEHRLSLELKRREIEQSEDPERKPLCDALDALLQSNQYVDVFDESDALLHHKYHLVYAVGSPKVLDGSSHRWVGAEALLRVLMSPASKRVREVLNTFPELFTVRTEYDQRCGAFNGFALSTAIEASANSRVALREALAEDLIDHASFELSWLRVVCECFPRVRTDLVAALCDCQLDCDTVLATLPIHLDGVQLQFLALRGLLAYGVLENCLEKRNRVTFGLPDVGTRKKALAIPFTAADLPAERSEFSHPDVSIVLTLLAYYHAGLTKKDVREAFALLLRLDVSERTQFYSDWFKSVETQVAPELVEMLSDLDHVSLDNAHQFAIVYDAYRYSMEVVNFYLNRHVFPRDTQQYPHRLSRTAWDLVKGPTNIGFSGTNDTHRLLPFGVTQREPDLASLRGTNGKMIDLLLTSTMGYAALVDSDLSGAANGTSVPMWKLLLQQALSKRCTALIDTGALLAGVALDGAARFLIEQDSFTGDGVTYYDTRKQFNCWVVLERAHLLVRPLKTSSVHERDTFVIFDEARSRGSDMKLYDDALGLLTLAPTITKDKLMQGAGRLRQLGRNQKLWFSSTSEVEHILRHRWDRRTDSRRSDTIQLVDILEWVMQNTQQQSTAGLLEWAHNGVQFCANLASAANELQKEDWTLERLYGDAVADVVMYDVIQRQLNATRIVEHVASTAVAAEIEARAQTYGREDKVHVTGFGEECERELQIEEEEEVESERPSAELEPRAEVDWDYNMLLSATCVADLRTVRIKSAYDAVKKLVTPSAMKKIAWASAKLYGTHNFWRTVVPPSGDATHPPPPTAYREWGDYRHGDCSHRLPSGMETSRSRHSEILRAPSASEPHGSKTSSDKNTMTASCCSKPDKPTYARLPTNVVPQKYFIDYDVVDLMNFRFEATERIQLDVKEATHTIVCHAIELCVYDVSVAIDVPGAAEGEASKKLSCTQIQFIPDDETVTFHFGEELPVGVTITLSLRFHGFLNDKMHGFYRSEYEVDGEKRPLAVTQFEACDARRAFVCWDEPAIKARFEISMVTDASLTALSNMHVVETKVRTKKNAQYCKDSRKDSAEEKYWKFAETPVMSTYIVAMAVGEFDVLSGKSEEGVEVNVYTPPGKSERARFALDVGVRALSFFTKQFGIAYPLQKLDMVSIRGYPGAMENWGLVTYGETALLVDEKLTSRQLLVGVARVVCHELSHQWFGNLVTMDWWTGLWLNEGFAQYMEFDAVNALFPEWKMWEMFVEQVLVGSAFPSDALVTSHPIEVEVHHPKEVQEIFDAISYQKGASVVRMLADFLGRDVFYQGVHNYLVKYSYKNTKTEDLWDALEEASGVKITKMANSWTKQTGFPLVTVEMSPDNGLTIKQERFFSDFDQKADDATLWDVPLTLITSKDSTIQRIGIWDAHSTLAESTKVTPLTASADVNERVCAAMPECVQWFKLNPNQSNYYLVNYPSVVWKQLQEPIKTRSLSTVDRLSLVSSAFMLATSGVLSVSDAFDFTAAYADEPEYLCWKVISSYLSKYLTMFAEEPFYPQLQAYTRELFSPTMKRLTWDPTDEDKVNSNTANFRAETIARLGDAGDEATIAEAHVRFARYASGDKTAFSADLRVPVMCMHAKNSPKEDSRAVVEQLKDLFAASDMEEEKLGMLLSMGHVPDVEVKREVLEWAFKNEAFQIMEIIYVLSGVGSTPSGVQLVWDHITANYDTILGRFSPMMTGIFVGVAVGRFQRASDADMVEKFMATKDTSSFKRRLDTALESIRLKSKQFDRDSSVLANWLTQRQ